MPIWEDEKYQAELQEQMVQQARRWFKNKINNIIEKEKGYNGF